MASCAGDLHDGRCVPEYRKSKGTAELVGTATLHEPSSAVSLHQCQSAVSLHKSMGAVTLWKSVGVASLHESVGVTSIQAKQRPLTHTGVRCVTHAV